MAGPEIPVAEALDTMLPVDLVLEEDFEHWFERRFKHDAMLAVALLRDRVERALEVEAKAVADREKLHREIWKVTPRDDHHSLVKQASSARAKVGRWLRDKVAEGAFKQRVRCPKEQIEDCIRDFPDLGRFRVTCNLFSDLEQAWKVLLGHGADITHRAGGDVKLLGTFRAGGLKNYATDLTLRHPARGHRARQCRALVPSADSGGQRDVWIEVQVMTRLQEAWDRRNHPIYEHCRVGGDLPDTFTLTDVALAEALFLLDQQAAQLWRDFLEHRGRTP